MGSDLPHRKIDGVVLKHFGEFANIQCNFLGRFVKSAQLS